MPVMLLLIALLSAIPARGDDAVLLVTDYDTFLRDQDPVRAGQRGDRDALRRWPDNSAAAVAARKTTLESFRARLAALPAGGSDDDVLNRRLIAARVDEALAGLAFDEERIPFISGDGFYTTPDYTALNTVLTTPDDAEAWLARLAAIPAYYARETANMRRGMRTGFTQPALTVRRAIADLRERTGKPAGDSPLLAPLATLSPQFPAAERNALRARALVLIEKDVRAAERTLLAFFEHEYLPRARTGIGVSTVPGGMDYYAFLVRRHTTTTLTPEEIHALGEREVARIRAAMDVTRRDAGFTGTFAEFLVHLRSAPRFYVTAPRYGEIAGEIARRADRALPRYFGRLPRLTYSVGPMPAGLESSANGYLPGNPAQGVPGMVVYKPWMAQQMPTFGLAPWVLHEGVPGHHLQIALGQELEGVPEFRRNDDLTAYVEGWALYAEFLGEEMGIYRDPFERFGRLSLEMWRACRLMIDTGIHVMGWSRERAAACLLENSALAPAEIEFELDRYIAWPGQALAYKVGEQKIIELRRGAQQTLGSRFDLRAFHDLVLGAGPMPLALLETRVAAWVASLQ